MASEMRGADARKLRESAESSAEWLERLDMDGTKWAAEFRKTAVSLGYSDMDEGWLIGWFCNAIMAGFDEATRRNRVALERVEALEAALRGQAGGANEDGLCWCTDDDYTLSDEHDDGCVRIRALLGESTPAPAGTQGGEE